MNDQQYTLLKNLEEEGIYGMQTIPYLIDGFDITEQDAKNILIQYMKLPKLNSAGQVSMGRYENVTTYDIIIGIIALIGICWAVSVIL